ncbi:MbnP family protein [Puia dinghuensis]|uniref:Copper-binding protein MbnP-like domain-containing protein n=1 Tax=Puia dinghuensis TaxID=1792502 RepID=A0A8J2XSE8_9BACT|nr:MbnP family protein [Puia dinghuensis]GGA94417.1 hypothetical protein GCM10011511_17130 [Puia dinghuensis]
MNIIQALLLIVLLDPVPHPLTIRFHNEVCNQPLHLDDQTYTNRFHEPFLILQCKYYIANILISDGKHEEQLPLQPHLVDQADSASLELHGQTTIAYPREIKFTIGVDSFYNIGGVRSGDLDPMLGMFWTWNTGYINARLEGLSDSAHAPAHRFTWDIGGYKAGQNTLRTITIPLPLSANAPALTPAAKSPGPTEILIHADLLHWFDGAHPIHLTRSPICHEPGPLAMQLADNYSTSFSCR